MSSKADLLMRARTRKDAGDVGYESWQSHTTIGVQLGHRDHST